MSPAQPTLSTTAMAIFVVLMAERQQVDSKELAELLGLRKLPSDALKQLKEARLVDVGKVGRFNAYALSANGWDRCVEIMGIPASATGSAPRALRTDMPWQPCPSTWSLCQMTSGADRTATCQNYTNRSSTASSMAYPWPGMTLRADHSA
jgi:hypothetical protein